MQKEPGKEWKMADGFFASHPVFTIADFDKFLVQRSNHSTVSPEARKSLLKHHQARQRIVRIRRGLYAAVPPGQTASNYPVDTFLIASRLTEDGVLAYHTALSLHGVAHSVREERLALTQKEPVASFTFQGITYRTTRPPADLSVSAALALEVEEQDRQGLLLRVTTLERTLVDVMDRPSLVGGWEEVWRSLEGLDVYLRVERVVTYTLLLRNTTTAAKVGYFLEVNQDRLGVAKKYLDELRAHIPKRPHYVERDRRSDSRLVKDWNLMVPASLYQNEKPPANDEEIIF